jgi:hypothetical protein
MSEATTNPFVALRGLLAGPGLQVGEVTAGAGSSWQVQLPGGGLITARGTAAVGQKVFVRGGVIESQAPAMPVVMVEV